MSFNKNMKAYAMATTITKEECEAKAKPCVMPAMSRAEPAVLHAVPDVVIKEEREEQVHPLDYSMKALSEAEVKEESSPTSAMIDTLVPPPKTTTKVRFTFCYVSKIFCN